MSDVSSNKPSDNFWIIAWASLVWNVIGLVIYIGQVTMSPEALAKLTQAQQEFFIGVPAWSNAVWAIAVNAGVFGSALMLFRKAWAVPMFALSLVSVILLDIDQFLLRDAYGILGVSSLIIPSMVLVIAIALLWYSRTAKSAGWLS